MHSVEMRQWQQEDSTLDHIHVRELADGKAMEDRNSQRSFYYKEGLLYRKWCSRSKKISVGEFEQLVLPKNCREQVLQLAHEVTMAGHLGITNTKDRILQHYYWPGIFKDVAEYCRTCEVCQRNPRQKPARVEMIPMPLVTHPFDHLAMNLVGPLPKSRKEDCFILLFPYPRLNHTYVCMYTAQKTP